MDSIFSFNGGFQKYFAECHRIHYLYGLINECYWDGGLMMGGQAFDAADVYAAFHKIEHYRGFFESIDLGAQYDDPDPDDPNPDPDDPYCNPDPDTTIIIIGDDHYRAQSVPCVVGVNNVTFSRPLSSADYELVIRNIQYRDIVMPVNETVFCFCYLCTEQMPLYEALRPR